ncbi:MAG: hypothetical protein N2662_01540, partial [Bacteroidales bacterium]|nr:hypothetical protein [Bacteroidales bacterium]
MLINNKLPEINQELIIEHHKQSRNFIFAILGYIYLIKSQQINAENTSADYYREIENLCFQLLEHEQSLVFTILFELNKQMLASNQL